MVLKKIILMIVLAAVLLSSCRFGPLDPRDPDDPWNAGYFMGGKY